MAAEAIQDSTKAIELGGKEQTIGRASATRAKSYRELGQIEAANADFKKALGLAPEYYIHDSLPDLVGRLASESSRLKSVGCVGIVVLIAVAFMVIFKRKRQSHWWLCQSVDPLRLLPIFLNPLPDFEQLCLGEVYLRMLQ